MSSASFFFGRSDTVGHGRRNRAVKRELRVGPSPPSPGAIDRATAN